MAVTTITPDDNRLFEWRGAADSIVEGHQRPKADIHDSLLHRNRDSLLTRSAWIDGLGMLVKAASIFPDNVERPTVDGYAAYFDDRDGRLAATIDFSLLTAWKTAADSFVAAERLAPVNVDSVLLIGAGSVAGSLCLAYRELFPDAQISVTARTAESAERFADTRPGVTVARDIATAVKAADLVSVATTSDTPVLRGEWLREGQHVDLVGAYRPDTREADDDVLRRGSLFVDSRATTLDQIGELRDPLHRGVIGAEDIIADFYDLGSGRFERSTNEQITVFKNGGGAHIDLMVANYFVETVSARAGAH